MNDDTKVQILWIIGLILVIVIGLLSYAWVNSPDVLMTIRFEMDNNTLQAFQSINYTMLN